MNRHFFSKIIKVLSVITVLSFFISTTLHAADTVALKVSVTRTKDTYPTTLTIHTEITKDQAEANDNLKIKVLEGTTLVEEKTVNVGTQKQDFDGKDYIKSATNKEFTETEAGKTYTYTVYLLDKDGKERGTSSVAYVPKSLKQGETKTVIQADGSGKTIDDKTYTYLEPLPGFGSTFDITQTGAISNYIGTLFKLILGIMGVVAVFEIIQLGIQTMSDSFTQQKFAKKRLTNIIMALIIALCSVLLLKTINPNLVDFNFGIQRLKIEVPKIGGDTPQKPDKNGMLCAYSGFAGYKKDSTWSFSGDDADSVIREKLKPIQVSQGACTKVGQTSCVSVGALDTAFVNRLYNKCPDNACKNAIVITEGTGCWFHNANSIKAHYPDGWTVDLKQTPELTKLIHGWKKGPYFNNWGQCYAFADNGLAVVEESDHFHAYSLTGGCSAAGQGR